MKKNTFRFVIAAIVTFGCVACNIVETDSQLLDIPIEFYESAEIAHPFSFSRALKSDKWKNMNSDERNNLFQIPKTELNNMNEIDLAMTCVFYYPRRFDILSAEHPMSLFDQFKEVNNGYDKLFNMPSAGDAILALLKNYETMQHVGNARSVFGESLSDNTIERFQLNYICCMLASKDFSNKLSSSTCHAIIEEILRRTYIHKTNSSQTQDINILYAVMARMMTRIYPLSEDENQKIDYFIYTTTLFEESHQDFIDFIDSVRDRLSLTEQ